MLVLLGPTATGKTALAAQVARRIGGEIISADSRQVYRGMDIGTGKDYGDYTVDGIPVPAHLIDIAEPGEEYNIFQYQRDFLAAYNAIVARSRVPVLCGGSGMYLEAVLRGYRLAPDGGEDDFIRSLEAKTDDELADLLRSMKTLHNITDLEDRPRMLQAIRIARAAMADKEQQGHGQFPAIKSLVFGIDFPRALVRERISVRLRERLDNGLIEEGERLLASGITPERLMRYGLEYRFLALYLTGQISRDELFRGLETAIHQFAKRQMTWFRRMERQGVVIHWIDGQLPMDEKVAAVLKLAEL